MKNTKDNSERIMKIAIFFAVAVPWGIFMVVRDGHKALAVVPVILILVLTLDLLPNYLFYRRCKRIVGEGGGTILFHNFNYSKLAIDAGGMRTEISITRGFRAPTYISLTAPFKSICIIKFWLRPTDCFDKPHAFFIEA
jgi:hypothetical protein